MNIDELEYSKLPKNKGKVKYIYKEYGRFKCKYYDEIEFAIFKVWEGDEGKTVRIEYDDIVLDKNKIYSLVEEMDVASDMFDGDN